MAKKVENLDDICKNEKLKIDNIPIEIKNYADFLKYLDKINNKAKNVQINYEQYESGSSNFLPVFDEDIKFCYETISGTIKHTQQLKIKLESNSSTEFINNVFILNKEKDKYCYEIKLGNGTWDNLTLNKSDFNIFDNDYNNRNTFKIGLLKINRSEFNNINKNLKLYNGKITKSSSKTNNYESASLSENQKGKLIEKYKYFKTSIYYSYDLNNTIRKSNCGVNNKQIQSLMETIHKNDIIGISVDKISMHGFIQFKIFINGELIHYKLIPNINEDTSDNYSNYDDEDIENNETKDILISFIELGPNNSIFIKDKPNDNKIVSNEKMSYYDSYNLPSLNDFPQNIEEAQNLTDLYLDMMKKIGINLINSFPDILYKNDANNLTNIFNNIIFNNKIILKNKFLSFLCYDFTPNDTKSFKDSLTSFFLIIYQNIYLYNKNKLINIFIDLLIELISEQNFDFIDSLKIYENSEEKIFKLIRLKFALCFLLFDGFMNEKDFINYLFNNLQDSFLENHEFTISLFFSLFNNILYVEPLKAYNFLKESRFYNNCKFNKNKLILFNFEKPKNKSSSINDYAMQYFEFIIKNVIINQLLFKKEKYENIIQYTLINSKLNDNFSLINGVLCTLITFLKKANINSINKISNNIGKILYFNYIDSENCNIFKEKETFFGKIKNKNLRPETFQAIKKYFFCRIDKSEKIIFFIHRLALISISKYYKKFSKFVIKVNNFIDNYNNGDNNKINFLYELSQSVEFFQVFFSYYSYDKFIFYFYYLSEILKYSIENEEFLHYLPYKEYLYNILFIIDVLNIRCKVIDENNLFNEDEPFLIPYIIQNILKFTVFYLGQEIPNINYNNFFNKRKYEKNIFLHIIIFLKILNFDIHIIKDIIPEIKNNLILSIKNLYDLSLIKENKIINKGINKLIEYLYSFGVTEDHQPKIDFSVKENLFIYIMKEENKNYKPIDTEKNSTHHNNVIKNTMYYYIFMIIYNKIKKIRNSLIKIMDKNSNSNEKKIFLIQLTYSLNELYNFFIENELFMCYDINCILFIKINSFLCKTFKQLLTDENFSILYSLSMAIKEKKENDDIVLQFFTQLFLVISVIIYNKENYKSNYYRNFLYEIARNRKGFHFDRIKNNISKYFKNNKNYKNIVDLLNKNLTKLFKEICQEEDVLNENDVNDNSIELESRVVCSICQMDEPELDAHLKDCNHEFHMECIKQLINSNSSCSRKCPLCKRVITGIKEDPDFIVSNNNELNLDNSHFNNNNFINNRRRYYNNQNNRFFINNNYRNNNIFSFNSFNYRNNY